MLNAPPVKCTVTVYYGDGRCEDYELRLQSISMSTSSWGSGQQMKVEGNVINVRGRGDEPAQVSNGTNPQAWIPADPPPRSNREYYGGYPDQFYVSPAVFEALKREGLEPGVPAVPAKPKEPPATAADLLKTLGR